MLPNVILVHMDSNKNVNRKLVVELLCKQDTACYNKF